MLISIHNSFIFIIDLSSLKTQLLWEVESELRLGSSGPPVLGLQVMSVLGEP